MSTRNIQKDIETLRALLPRLRAGEIYAIEFGDPHHPKGFMTHHRIRLIATPGGEQFCFKQVMRGMEGSGDYVGLPDDRTLEIKAQSLLEKYFAPTPFSEQLQKFRGALPSDKLTYFVIEQED